MSWVPDRYRALRSLLRGQRIEDEVREEFEHHIAMRTEEFMAAGMDPEEAAAEVRRRLGDVGEYARETRRIDERIARERRRTAFADSLAREGGQAIRSIVRRPFFSFIAVLTLGLGLGATTGIYTLLDAVVLRPLPYPAADRLVALASVAPGMSPGKWGVAEAQYFYYRRENRSLDDLGVYYSTYGTLIGPDGAERVELAATSASVMDVLGARTALGRLPSAADDKPGAPAVVVMSHAFWTRRYGADASVIGRVIELNAGPAEVIGVMAPGFALPRDHADLWSTLRLDPAATPQNSHYLNAVGRLRAGVTPDALRQDLDRLTQRLPELFPTAYSDRFMREARFGADVETLRDQVVGEMARTLWILLAAVGLVLLIACANVANLFLVRTESRRREVALRTALGADRIHLAWHYLTESILLGLAAGVLGLLLAWSGIRGLVRIGPPIPRFEEVHLGGSGVLFALALAVGCGIAFGLFPLARAGGAMGALREGGRGSSLSRGQRAIRGGLIVVQVALALILLASAGLLVRSYRNLRAVSPGVRPEGVLTSRISVPRANYPDYSAAADFYQRLLARIESLPGVESVGATEALPFTGPGACTILWVEDRPLPEGAEPPCLPKPAVTPGYFEAAGIRVEGRAFDWREVNGRTGAVVVSRAFADRFWPGEDAIGKGVSLSRGEPPYYRVVGVASNVYGNGLDEPPLESVYFPILPMEGTGLWGPYRSMYVVVRTNAQSPAALVPSIRRVLAELDPGVPLASVSMLDDILDESMARRSFTMLLLGIAAAMALVLSAVGIYGVISFIVGERRGEMGIRMALGAAAGDVGRMVVGESVRLAGLGVALGLAGAFAATRVLRALLFNVSATDPLTLAFVAAIIIIIALLASWAPARAAARVDPIETLRME